MQNDKHTKTVQRQKNMPPAIIPDKAIIWHTLEDAGILNLDFEAGRNPVNAPHFEDLGSRLLRV